MRKTPRGWIQIGESRTRGVARIPLGLKPSRDSRATSQRDSPIWIQPLGVFRYKILLVYKCGHQYDIYRVNSFIIESGQWHVSCYSRTPVTKIMKWCPWETSNYLTQLWTKCILLCPIQWFNVNMPSQWETMLQCNSVSHWLGTFTKWSLHIGPNQTSWSTFNYLLI